MVDPVLRPALAASQDLRGRALHADEASLRSVGVHDGHPVLAVDARLDPQHGVPSPDVPRVETGVAGAVEEGQLGRAAADLGIRVAEIGLVTERADGQRADEPGIDG